MKRITSLVIIGLLLATLTVTAFATGAVDLTPDPTAPAPSTAPAPTEPMVISPRPTETAKPTVPPAPTEPMVISPRPTETDKPTETPAPTEIVTIGAESETEGRSAWFYVGIGVGVAIVGVAAFMVLKKKKQQ